MGPPLRGIRVASAGRRVIRFRRPSSFLVGLTGQVAAAPTDGATHSTTSVAVTTVESEDTEGVTRLWGIGRSDLSVSS